MELPKLWSGIGSPGNPRSTTIRQGLQPELRYATNVGELQFTPVAKEFRLLTSAPHHFSDRLLNAVQQKKTPLVVGIDPRADRLPTALCPKDPRDLSALADAFQKFSFGVIDSVAALVPAIKPQAAFFEMLGPVGMQALHAVVRHAREANLIVIMDAKRGDIGSTAEAYAEAFLGHDSPWGCDALTINPYLGGDTLEPFVETAEEKGSGLFILAKTSNPGSNMIQDLSIDGEPVYSKVANLIQWLTANSIGNKGYGSVGAVVGATYPDQLAELRAKMPNSILLIPGLGAQGGTARDVAPGFDENGLGALVNSSRAIIFAHERPEFKNLSNWQSAVEQSTRDTIDQLAADTNAGKLRRPQG